jgi:hypothetical protein
MLDHAHLSRTLGTSVLHPLLAGALALAVLTAGCSKTEGTSSGTTADASMAMPSSTMSAAMAAPDASPMAADTTTGNAPTGGADASASGGAAAVTASASAGTTAPAISGSAAATAPACGTKPLPDCPLQAWMKANTNPAIASQDFPGLATALDKAATFAPAGYTNWASIAKDGAKAARASDMTATKASCRTCHDQYKEKYKKELRGRKI